MALVLHSHEEVSNQCCHRDVPGGWCVSTTDIQERYTEFCRGMIVVTGIELDI